MWNKALNKACNKCGLKYGKTLNKCGLFFGTEL